MKWGKFGGIALLCIAFALTAPAAASAVINIIVDYPVGGEVIDEMYMDVNWTTSGCDSAPQIAVYYDTNTNFTDGATLVKSGEADDGHYLLSLAGVQIGDYYVALRFSCGEPFEIETNYSAGKFTKLGFNISYTSNYVNVTVNATSPPNITYIAPDNNVYVRGQQKIIFNVSDPDGDEIYGSIYYSGTRGAFNHSISGNINMENHCTDSDNDTSTPNNCTYVWDTTGLEGDYYIDILISDGISNATNSSTSTVNVTNSFTASVLYPNGGETIDEMYIDVNWTASDVVPEFTIISADIYYDDDGSLATGRNLLSANETGNYTWDLKGFAHDNYYACIEAHSNGFDNLSNNITLSYYDCSDNYFTYEGYNVSYTSNQMPVTVSANTRPNVTITYPNSGSFTTNITILFNVSDEDGDPISASLYYSTAQGSFENLIAANLDLTNSTICTDDDANTSTPNNCSYFWDTSALNANYYIDIVVNDGLDTANDSSNNAITIDNIPIISNITSTNTTTNSTLITWLTNEPANSTVYYWINSTLNYTYGNTSNVTSHNATLESLNGNRLHYYQIESCDTNGNCIISAVYNFTTLNSLPAVQVTYPNGGESLTTRYVSINWTASDLDNDTINISIYSDFNNIKGDGRTLIAANVSNSGNYTWDILDLSPGDYYISIDASSYNAINDTAISVTDYSDASFAKAGIPLQYSSNQMHAVVSGNNIPNVTVVYPNSGSFTTNITILFNVSDADDDYLAGSLYYSSTQGGLENLIVAGLDLSNSSICTDNDANTSTPNNCTYFWESSGLNANYYIDIIANDSVDAGNDSSDSQITIDNIPIISNISITNTTTNSTLLNWLTNEPANSTVHYWINSTLNYTAANTSYVTSHNITLENLNGNKIYYYQVESCDNTGNCVASSTQSFVTLNNLPQLQVTYPNGGESFNTTSIIINWTAADADGEELLISIYYDINNIPTDGRTLIAANISNTGSYTWDSAGIEPGNYMIGIEVQQYDYANSTTITVSDYSDDYFTKEEVVLQYASNSITSTVSSNTAPSMLLTSPNERMVFREVVPITLNVSDNESDDLFLHSFTLIGDVYKRKITVNNSNDFDLVNYPVNITLDTFLLYQQKKIRIDGKKIRITVGGEEVSWHNSTPFNTVETRIWFPLNITERTVRDDIYVIYGNDSFVALDTSGEPWENFMSKENLVLNKPVDAVTENPSYLATKSNDGSYSTKWRGTNYDLSLNESLEFLKYTLDSASRAYKVHYRLTGLGIETVNSVFLRTGGNTSISHLFNSSMTSFTDYFEPIALSEFVVDIRSIISHPEFYEVEVYEPVLLDVDMGPEENATMVVKADYSYIGGDSCTDPDNNASTPNNCTYNFEAGNADGIYTLCVNITDGTEFASDCTDVTIVINTLNWAPNMSIVFINSSNGTYTEEESLTCWANATDFDQDDFSFEGFWYKNGIQNKSFSTYPTLYFPHEFVNVSTLHKTEIDYQENWSCMVRAYDMREYSSYISTDNITIGFGPVPPEIWWANNTPDFTYLGGNITITANVTDNNSQSNINIVRVGITYPGGPERNYTMSQISSQLWQLTRPYYGNGTSSYTVYAIDDQGLEALVPKSGTFEMYGQGYVSIAIDADNNSFSEGDIINVTDST